MELMEIKAVSEWTGEEFPFFSIDRSTLEKLMLDEFDVYVHEGDDDYPIYYNTASDSFQYEKNCAIYSLNFT